jgi:DegV family protein with EDD domain
MDKTYLDGITLTPDKLYQLYQENPSEISKTSQPSVGDFADIYNKYDEEIISIHLSSGLSGAYSSAVNAAKLVDENRITVIDTKTVGPALGWIVETAARGVQKKWSKERILEAIEEVRKNTITMVSFSDLKYLINSGRISHLQGIMASVLKIKPIIGMNESDGRYSNLGKEITVQKTINKMSSLVANRFGNVKIRIQLMHGNNLPKAADLQKTMLSLIDGIENKLMTITPVLGAHAGPTVIGVAAMPESVYATYLTD